MLTHIRKEMSKMKDKIEEIKEGKLILKGEDIKDGVDYSHFNFMIHILEEKLNTVLEDDDKSPFDALKLFWEEFFPYLEAELVDKENLFLKFKETNADADATVQMGMEFKFKLDHAEAFIRQCGKGSFQAYEHRLAKARDQLKKEMDRQIREEAAKNED